MLKYILLSSIAIPLGLGSVTVFAAPSNNFTHNHLSHWSETHQSEQYSDNATSPSSDSMSKTPGSVGETLSRSLQYGRHGSIRANLDGCSFMDNSEQPTGIRFMNVYFSTASGSKVDIDPNNESKYVYQFSNHFDVFGSDMDEYIGTNFIAIGAKTSTVVIKSRQARRNIHDSAPVWSYFRYKCNNNELTFFAMD